MQIFVLDGDSDISGPCEYKFGDKGEIVGCWSNEVNDEVCTVLSVTCPV